METGKKVNIMLVDDHPLFRDGLRNLLAGDEDFRIVAEASMGVSALNHARSQDIDMVVMDIELKTEPDGFELTAQLRALPRPPFVLMVSMHNAPPYIERARRAGAQGYISKDEPSELILYAVDEVAEGRCYWPPVKKQPGDKPTPAEMRVLKYIAQGKISRDIARILGIKTHTVEAHRYNIRWKNNLKTPADLPLFAKECMELYGIPEDDLPKAREGREGGGAAPAPERPCYLEQPS